MSKSLGNIPSRYGVPAAVGGRVSFKLGEDMVDGTIVGRKDSALRVEITQGDAKQVVSVHPHRAIYYGSKT